MLFLAALIIPSLCVEIRAAAPITTEETKSVASTIEASLRAGDSSVLKGLIDDSAFLDTACQGLTFTPAYRAGLASGMKLSDQLTRGISNVVKQGGTYHFLGLVTTDGAEHPLFRLLMRQGGLNYHEFTLGRTADGTIRIVDMYVFATGELMTQTIHRPLVAAAASNDRNIIQRLIGTDNDWITHLSDISQLQQQVSGRQWQQAAQTYNALPDSLKQNKTLMLLWVTTAEHTNRNDYTTAMANYEAAFPGDPSLLLMKIDSQFLAKQYDEEMQTLDQLDQRVGGDPYLDMLRGGARKAQGRTEESAKLFRSAAEREPDLKRAWEAAVTETLKTGDYGKVVELLDESEQKGGIRWTKVSSAPVFADFVKSKEYADWVQTHPQRAPVTQPAQ
jgi:hypothetical protein